MWLWLCTFPAKLWHSHCGGTDVVVIPYFSSKAVMVLCCGGTDVVVVVYFFNKAAAFSLWRD